MNLTHLVLFNFWSGAGGAVPPGSHTPFILAGTMGTYAILVTAQRIHVVEIGVQATFGILGITIPGPLQSEVSSSPSMTILMEVL